MRNRTENQMRVFFIRHGAVLSNEERRYVGRTDEGLSENGIAGIKKNMEAGKYPNAELIAASPMLRCIQTAELIYGGKPDIVIEKWKEMDFGSFEGKTYEELKADASYIKWLESRGELSVPEGEGKGAFIRRSVDGFNEFCRKAACISPMPHTAALIVHGGTIMAVLSAYSNGDYYDFQCGNGEGYRCELHIGESIWIDKINRRIKGF